jgi:hypothetical protein
VPLKSIVMAVVLSGWLMASVMAFMMVAYTSFAGIGVIGLMIWYVCSRLDQEQDGPPTVWSPDSFARQVRGRAEMSRAERAALRSEKWLAGRSIRFFRRLGMALVAIGLGGFLCFQL